MGGWWWYADKRQYSSCYRMRSLETISLRNSAVEYLQLPDVDYAVLSRKYCMKGEQIPNRHNSFTDLYFFVSAKNCFHLTISLLYSVTIRYLAGETSESFRFWFEYNFYQHKWLLFLNQCHNICNQVTLQKVTLRWYRKILCMVWTMGAHGRR